MGWAAPWLARTLARPLGLLEADVDDATSSSLSSSSSGAPRGGIGYAAGILDLFCTQGWTPPDSFLCRRLHRCRAISSGRSALAEYRGWHVPMGHNHPLGLAAWAVLMCLFSPEARAYSRLQWGHSNPMG